LDSTTLPKALLDIEGGSLISHVLRQLHRGGIRHVVLVLSYHGEKTAAEVERFCKTCPGLTVEIVHLGTDWNGFYAKSLLAVRDSFHLHEADCPGVLIATADHIFDEKMVADMCSFRLEQEAADVCVLTDFARKPFAGLPETTVGVRVEKCRVVEVSRALGRPAVAGAPGRPGIGVEAGLFSCRGRLFDCLASLAERRKYFTLTDAVQELAEAGLVASLATAGRRWVAVETEEELEVTRGCDSHKLQRSPQSSPRDSESPQYLREPMPICFVAGGKDTR